MAGALVTFEPVFAPGWIALLLIPPAGLLVWQLISVWKDGARGAPIRRLIIVILLFVAALGPAVPGGLTRQIVSDSDVFILMDTTTSSNAEDWGDGQTRLDGMKEDVRAITDAYAGSHFSLITFDSAAVVRVPLISDAEALLSQLDVLEVEVTLYSAGSSPYEANQVLAQKLAEAKRAHGERVRVVFYLGDGESTRDGDDQPTDFGAAKGSFDVGSVLGYGTEQGARMLENPFDIDLAFGPQSDDPVDPTLPVDPNNPAATPTPIPTEAPTYVVDPETNSDAISKIDEGTLKDIASDLGVDYQHRTAGTAPSLPDIGDRLGVEVEVANFSIAERLYWIPVIPAFLLLGWELIGAWNRLVELRRARPKPLS